MFGVLDEVRRAQGTVLEGLGFGPTECSYHILASGPHWSLRGYGGSDAGPCLLIVAAPIKRPYIWDLAPGVSAVRFCLDHGLRVYLLEWSPPSPGNGNAGLAEYTDQAVGRAVDRLTRETGTQPFLMGHSLGGTFAAIFAALAPETARGLVLLGAPLCFRPGISRFRDAIVAIAPSSLAEMEVIPGSLLSQLSAWASPKTFVWSRLLDATLNSADPLGRAIHARVERWALDEVPLRARLVREIPTVAVPGGPALPRDPVDPGQDCGATTTAASDARGGQSDGRNRASGVGPALHRSDPRRGHRRSRISRRDRRRPAASWHPGRPQGLRAGLARDHLMAEGSGLNR